MSAPINQEQPEESPSQSLVSFTDKIGTSGMSESNPMHLHNAFMLDAGVSMWITCPHIVEALGGHESVGWGGSGFFVFELDCRKPMRVTFEDQTMLIPRIVLGPVFENGWNKLPTELKAEVLRHNLCDSEYIGSYSRREKEQLLHHLRMTPEISAMSKELFYGTNTIHLYSGWDRISGCYFPPLSVRSFIRRVRVEATLGVSSEWDFLGLCSRVLRQFPNIQNLEVVFNWGLSHVNEGFHPLDTNHWIQLVEDGTGETVPFGCRGKLVLQGAPTAQDPNRIKPWTPYGDDSALIKDMVRQKISFAS